MLVVLRTATIDLLTAQGQFPGGCIMPGVGTMLRSCMAAALPDADGVYSVRCKPSILSSQAASTRRPGPWNASMICIGAIIRMLCLVSGRAANAPTPHLAIVFRYHDNR